MKRFPFPGLAAALLVGVATPAPALEKASRHLPAELAEDWGASNTFTVRYYNFCTGWVWTWTGWSPGEQVGVCYDVGQSFFQLRTTWHLAFSPAPSGYGFTGTIELLDSCDCEGMSLASRPFLPGIDGWTAVDWGEAGIGTSEFQIRTTMQAPSGLMNPTGLATDRPAQGPTGPQACGTCYPTTRESRTRHLGIDGVLCPGDVLRDPVCDVEMVWEINIVAYIGAESHSWTSIKSLYR